MVEDNLSKYLEKTKIVGSKYFHSKDLPINVIAVYLIPVKSRIRLSRKVSQLCPQKFWRGI